MSMNAVVSTNRWVGTSNAITANGSYTLPKFAFIPHPSTQLLSTGMVGNPAGGIVSANFANLTATSQRPYPVPVTPSLYGIRSVQIKSSP